MLDADCAGVKFRISAKLPRKTVIVVGLDVGILDLRSKFRYWVLGDNYIAMGHARQTSRSQ